MIPDFILHIDTEKAIRLQLDHPAQAVLISGQTGIGLTTIARYVAASLLNIGMPMLHSNEYYREVTPEKAVISIDQVRRIQEFMRLKVPGSAQISRVVLIDDADTLNPAAQNALLKLLEEPPVGAVLLLTSSQPDRLLQTVRSRLSSITVKTPAKATVVQFFVGGGADESVVTRQYMVSNGSLSAMAKAFDATQLDTTSVLDTVRQLLGGTTYDRLLQLDTVSKDKIAAAAIVSTLAEVAAASLEQAARSGKTTAERWRAVLQAAYTAEEAISKNGNTKLVLTDLALSL